MVNRIKSLKLGNNRLHALHFSQLALGLSKNSILTVLYLENNKMNTVSCKLLAPFIKYSKSLSIFDISGNAIGDEGVI